MDINPSYFRTNDLISSNPFNSFQNNLNNNPNNFVHSKKINNNNDSNHSNQQGSPHSVQFKPLLEKKHLFVINSVHRNFQINDDKNPSSIETLFNFQVKLNPSISTKEKIPIYKNNPTLRQNQTQKENGVVGDLNPLYNGREAKGDIIGYESIIYSGEKGCKIENTYRNIFEFNLKKIEIPKKLVEYINPSLQSLSLSIQELSGFSRIHTTDGNLENVTFILEPWIFSQTSILYKNDSPIHFSIPTNQLNKLTIKAAFPFQKNKIKIDILVIEYCELTVEDTSGSATINFYTHGNGDLFGPKTRIKFDSVLFIQNDEGNQNINVADGVKVKNLLDIIVGSEEIFSAAKFDTIDEYHIISLRYSELLSMHETIRNFEEDHNVQVIFNALSTKEEKKLKYLTASTKQISGSLSYKVVPKIINVDIQMQLIFEIKTREDM
jgi:hypothetical protein